MLDIGASKNLLFETLRGCIQSLLLMTFADLESIGVFNTDF